MSVSALNFVFELAGVDSTRKLVLLALADRTNDRRGGVAWPSLARIEAMTGLHRRTIQRTLNALLDEGHLEVVAAGGGGHKTTVYRILGRGGGEPPLEVAESPVEVALSTRGGGGAPPKPLEPLGTNTPDAEALIEEWANITGTPLTRTLRRKWYVPAVDFLSANSSITEGDLEPFLRYAHREGCRGPAGWPHFAGGYLRQRKTSGIDPELTRRAAATREAILRGDA